MKYLAMICLLSAVAIGCKKNYDCSCTYNDGTEEVTEVYDMGKQTGQDAKEKCADQSISLENAGGTDVSCEALLQ